MLPGSCVAAQLALPPETSLGASRSGAQRLGWEFTLCFCPTGDAGIGSSSVSSLKSEDFHVRGLFADLSGDEIWGSSHTLKSCGKAVSIETASLSEYARYVLRTICQQVSSETPPLPSGQKHCY